MKVLIPGISGGIGRKLALRLLEAGHDVIGIDARPWPITPSPPENLSLNVVFKPGSTATFSIKTVVVRIRPEWVLPTLVGVGVFVAALSSAPWHTLLALGAIYLASLPVGWWSAWRLSRRDAAAGAATVPPESIAPRIVHLDGERDERENARSKAR